MAFITCTPLTLNGSTSTTAVKTTGRKSISVARSRVITKSTLNDGPNPKTQENDPLPTPTTMPTTLENALQAITPENLATIALALSFLLLDPSSAEAVSFPPAAKEAFKTLPASLLHPAVMWGVTGTTLYTLWLGVQSAQIRSDKITPEKRKELVKAKVTDKHFKVSSSLFAVVSLATFFGMANTFNRAGKLFPGPHLYVGLGVVALLSVMSSFVPYMQKGKDWARNSHFAAGLIVTGFFVWQAQSGMVIVGKLTKWW